MRRHVITLFAFVLAGSLWADAPARQTRPALSTNYVCTARSISGRRYSAEGTDRTLTQEAAMQKCQADSWRCYPTGCTP